MRTILLTLLAVFLLKPAFGQESAIYGNDGPRFDVSLGYQRVQANAPPAQCNCFGANGGFADVNFWLTRMVGITGEVSGSERSNISSLGQNLTLTTFMAGPHIQLPIHRIIPYGEFLFGAAHGSDSYFPTGNTYQTSATSFAYAPGGGIDIDITKRISVRAVEARYLHTSFPNGTSNVQNQLMIGAGIDIRFGHRSHWASSQPMPPAPPPPPVVVAPPPPPPPPPPAITDLECTSASTDIMAGTTLSIASTSQTSPAGQDVTYSWTSSGGNVLGSGTRVTVDTTSLPPGEYHVTGRAQLASDPTAVRTCDVMFRVTAPPPPPEVTRAEKEKEFRENVHDVFFDLNKAIIKPAEEATLQHNAQFLKANPDIRILVDGFADERGAVRYNLTLGEKRANAVRNELIHLGVAADRIQIVTFGHDAQICTAGNETCWQQNRRVGFIMQP